MPPQLFTARTSEHTLLKDKFQWVQFELVEPHQIEFQAGQFIMLNVPGMPAKRSYSIASPPSLTHQIDILVDVGPQGDGSMYLQSLNPGEEVTFLAPAGQFTLSSNIETEKNLVMIATGSGISAIRSMILELLQHQGDVRNITLLWGMRYIEDVFWEEDFRLLEKQFPQFHFDLVLSKAPPDWPLCHGHVTDCLNTHFHNFTQTGYYLCGNQIMIKNTQALLATKGVDPNLIHHERFF
jgi:NAD(P)H-flavin reductase